MISKPKILFVLHLPPPVHGAGMMGQYLMESQFIRNSFNCDFINLSTSESIDEIGRGGVRKFLLLFKLYISVVKALLSKKYDLCYMTLTAKGPGFYKDFFIVLILKVLGKKIIYHFHNKGVEKRRKSKFNHFLYKIAFKNTQSILLSKKLYSDVSYYVADDDVFFCPNGIPEFIDNNQYEPKSDSVVKFLFLSNMMTEKGVFVLLDACYLLNALNLIFECHFVGDFSEFPQAEFEKIIENRGLNKRVFFHGKQFGDDKIKYYKDSDIFVFPTYYHNECFPLVIIEAMQFGLPVVSTFEGGIPDIVVDGVTGFLVPQKDVQVLANKLMVLIENKNLRKSMGQEGKKMYKELYTLQNFEHNISLIINKVISNGK